MSHVETVKVTILDLKALKAACIRLGVEFREGQTTYAWFGRSVGDYKIPDGMTGADLGHCSHAIHVKGVEYEVGLVAKKDGKPGYTLAYDFWGPGQGLLKKFGKTLGELVNAYTAEVLKAKARAKGYVVREESVAGKIKIYVTGIR